MKRKLSEDDRRNIITAYSGAGRRHGMQAELARAYNVSVPTINRIVGAKNPRRVFGYDSTVEHDDTQLTTVL